MSVELDLVPIFLVSDTDIEATTNQRWIPDGHLANPHVFRVVITSQWHGSPCSFCKITTFLGCMSVNQTPCQFCWPSTADTESADKIGRVKPPLVVRALSRMSTHYLDNNIQFGVRTRRHALELRDEQGMCCLQRDNMTEEQTAGLRRPMSPSWHTNMSPSRHTNMHQDVA